MRERKTRITSRSQVGTRLRRIILATLSFAVAAVALPQEDQRSTVPSASKVEEILEEVCALKPRPQSVSITAPYVSGLQTAVTVTYETAKECPRLDNAAFPILEPENPMFHAYATHLLPPHYPYWVDNPEDFLRQKYGQVFDWSTDVPHYMKR